MSRQRRQMLRRLPLFAVCCLLLVVFLFYAPQGFGQKKEFVVRRGESVNQISSHLKEAGLIRSMFIFETAVWLRRKGGVLQEGTFVLSNRMSVMDVVDALSNPVDNHTVKVTIPEGFTLTEIYGLFAERGIASLNSFERLSPADFPAFDFLNGVERLEGFLFPETHFFKTNVDPVIVVTTHLKEFQKRMIPIYEAGPRDRSLYDTLIMASIIEAEVPHEEDRSIISGILWKRLDVGMPLQVDSTLNYAIGGTRASLTAEELKTDSPYNTYLYPGLPPTPIGNPGESAMNAAVNPKESPYWFFLSGTDGVTHFARDFEEHKRNKARFLK